MVGHARAERLQGGAEPAASEAAAIAAPAGRRPQRCAGLSGLLERAAIPTAAKAAETAATWCAGRSRGRKAHAVLAQARPVCRESGIRCCAAGRRGLAATARDQQSRQPHHRCSAGQPCCPARQPGRPGPDLCSHCAPKSGLAHVPARHQEMMPAINDRKLKPGCRLARRRGAGRPGGGLLVA